MQDGPFFQFWRTNRLALASAAFVLGGFGVQACIAQQPAAGEPRRPNVVIFMTDDQSQEDFACLGGDALTPTFDRIASEGLTLHNMHVTSTVCSPSRYSLLTGRYAGRCSSEHFMKEHPAGTMTRVENNAELEPDRPNLPRQLRALGYRTGFVGKSHVIDHRVLDHPASWEQYGLQAYDKTDDPRDPAINARFQHNHQWWCDRMKPYGFDEVDAFYAGNLRELYNEHTNVHNPDWTVAAANDFIRRNADVPFFLYVATTVPHGPAPWAMPKGKLAYSLDADPRMTGEGYLDTAPESGMRTRQSVRQRVQDANLNVRLRHHATWIDDAVGSILQTLESRGIDDDTLFIFLSDHGSRRHGKTTLYDNGMKVPSFARWPNGISPGTQTQALLTNIDIAPTILELAGSTQAQDMDGRSFAGVLQDPAQPHRHEIFGELGYARAIKTADWKYIATRYPANIQKQIDAGKLFDGFEDRKIERPYLTRNGHLGHFAAEQNPHYFVADQLYDLRNDPQETTNVADQHPEVVAEMKQRLSAQLKQFEDRPFGEFTEE
jgi:arylsulfatase A-like enzyme